MIKRPAMRDRRLEPQPATYNRELEDGLKKAIDQSVARVEEKIQATVDEAFAIGK